MTPEKTRRLAGQIAVYTSTHPSFGRYEMIDLLLEERAERQPVAVKERLPTEKESGSFFI